MNVLKKILKIIGYILMTLCVIFIIIETVIIIKAKIYKDEIPGIFGIKPMIVISSSMENTIKEGDLIFAKEIDPSKLEVGDIISYRNGENTVTTHRITQITYSENGEIEFVTKGDNNSLEDTDLVSGDRVEGIYIFKISKIGNFLLYLQEPQGFCVIILIVLIIGCIWIIGGKREDELESKIEDKEIENKNKDKNIENKNKDKEVENKNKNKNIESKNNKNKELEDKDKEKRIENKRKIKNKKKKNDKNLILTLVLFSINMIKNNYKIVRKEGNFNG